MVAFDIFADVVLARAGGLDVNERTLRCFFFFPSEEFSERVDSSSLVLVVMP